MEPLPQKHVFLPNRTHYKCNNVLRQDKAGVNEITMGWTYGKYVERMLGQESGCTESRRKKL